MAHGDAGRMTALGRETFSLRRKRLYFHSRSPRGSRTLPAAACPLEAVGNAPQHDDELRIRRPTLLLLPLHLCHRPGLHPPVRPGEPRVQRPARSDGARRGGPGERPGDLPHRLPPGVCLPAGRPPATRRRRPARGPRPAVRHPQPGARRAHQRRAPATGCGEARHHRVRHRPARLPPQGPELPEGRPVRPRDLHPGAPDLPPQDRPGLRGRAPAAARGRAAAGAGVGHRRGLRGRAPLPLPPRGGHGEPVGGPLRPGRLRREDQGAHRGRGRGLGEEPRRRHRRLLRGQQEGLLQGRAGPGAPHPGPDVADPERRGQGRRPRQGDGAPQADPGREGLRRGGEGVLRRPGQQGPGR